MARIAANNPSVETVGVRPTTRSLSLEVATLRERVDGVEMTVDDVDARMRTLEFGTSTDAVEVWESLARAVPQDDDSQTPTSATRAKDAEPEVDRSEVGDATPRSDLTEMGRPQPAHASQRDDRPAPASVFVVLTDGQFETLFGNASPTTGAIKGDGPRRGVIMRTT